MPASFCVSTYADGYPREVTASTAYALVDSELGVTARHPSICCVYAGKLGKSVKYAGTKIARLIYIFETRVIAGYASKQSEFPHSFGASIGVQHPFYVFLTLSQRSVTVDLFPT
jgi:hypothetical protein